MSNGNSSSFDGGRIKVPVEIGGLDANLTKDGLEICGYVEFPGIGRVPICKTITKEQAERFWDRASHDVRAEWARFFRRGGLKGWWDRLRGKK